MAMNPVVYPNLAYQSQRDFEPVVAAGLDPRSPAGEPAVPAQSVKELIALAKANPGKLNHATGGTATLLALELFKAMAQVDITSIPFRGGAPAVTGAMSGQTQMIFADLATANAGMQSGKLRTLAVTTAERVPGCPTCRPIDESGVPGYDVATWIGAFAPAGTPKTIVGKIEADIKQALAAPDVKRQARGAQHGDQVGRERGDARHARRRHREVGPPGQGEEYPDRAVRQRTVAAHDSRSVLASPPPLAQGCRICCAWCLLRVRGIAEKAAPSAAYAIASPQAGEGAHRDRGTGIDHTSIVPCAKNRLA